MWVTFAYYVKVEKSPNRKLYQSVQKFLDWTTDQVEDHLFGLTEQSILTNH